MSAAKLGGVERSMLKALARSTQATSIEVAAMLPDAGKNEVESAGAALMQAHLVELVPNSATGAMRLTADGSRVAASLPVEERTGSGGGDSKFN